MVAVTRRDVNMLRDGVERVVDLPDSTSPDQLERALARLLAEHVRPGGSVDPAVLQDLVATLSRFDMRLPTDVVLLSRALVTVDGTLRTLCPDISLVSAATQLVDGSGESATGRRPPGAGSRRVAGAGAAPPPAARACRPHPHVDRPGRAPHPQHRRRGQPASRSHVGQPVPARGRRRFVPAPLDVAARRRRRRARSSPVRRACSTCSATAACSSDPCWSCGSSPQSQGTERHESDLTTRRHSGGRHAAVGFDARPPGERYYRHPGDIVRVVIWGAATVLLILLIEVAEGTNDGIREDLGEAAGLVPRAVRELALGIAQLMAVVIPVVVAVAILWRRRWRRAGLLALAAAAGAAATSCSTRRWPRRSGARRARGDVVAGVDALPARRVPRRRGGWQQWSASRGCRASGGE